MPVEMIEDTQNTIEVFQNDIELYTRLYCEKYNIDDICSISQNRFSGLLNYLYRNIFSNVNLKEDNIYNNGFFSNTNYNAYNQNLINDLVDVYIDLCDCSDKIVSVQGFCKLIGINSDTIYAWCNDKASGRSSEILKKLNAERERTLSERLASGKVNPVGVLGCLNHWHGWSGVGNMQEDKAKQIETLENVRKNAALLSDNLTQDQPQKADNTPLELSDNLTQLQSQ